MKFKTLFSVISILLISISLQAHPWKPSHFVIIDTDGGIDDLRAINLMLSDPDIQVMGISCSSGALPATQAWVKVRSLLNRLYHHGIPVALNRQSAATGKTFPLALATQWGPEEGLDSSEAPTPIAMIRHLLKHSSDSITYISLGSLQGMTQALKEIPELRLTKLLWASEGSMEDSFNFQLNPAAAEEILSANLPLILVGPQAPLPYYGKEFTAALEDIHTPYAGVLREVLPGMLEQGHAFALQLYDELIPLYLQNPDLFQKNRNALLESYSAGNAGEEMRQAYRLALQGKTVVQHQVMNALPSDPDFYFEDLAPLVPDLLASHGYDEFSACIITNELHRHLGVYSIIGVKMGIRAREYFGVGVDQMQVVSLAGQQPPLSCMNDGIQVSTGATLGHGLISLSEEKPLLPAARFRYMDRQLEIRLKPEIAERIAAELKEINFIYGLNSNTYWELVRKKALNYWQHFDRHEIFELHLLP